jgi:creatine kinase
LLSFGTCLTNGFTNTVFSFQVHKSDLDPSKLVFTAEQAAHFSKYVKSTRIRAARNIAGYALPAGASKEHRAGVESVLKQAFASLPSELAGTYYPLGGLTPAQVRKLSSLCISN